MDSVILGLVVGFSSLVGTCICIELIERYRNRRLEHMPLLVHRNLHWRMKNLLPVHNEKLGSQPHSVSQGTYLELNGKPDLRGHLLRVPGGRNIVPPEKHIPQV